MRIVISLLILILLPIAAQAGLVGTVSLSLDVQTFAPIPEEGRVGMTSGIGPGDPALFDGLLVNASTVAGDVFTATSSNDPDFDGIVAKLTNGVADNLCLFAVLLIPPSSAAFYKITHLEKDWFALSSNDFAGYVIDKATLTFDAISFQTTGNGTSMHVEYTIRLYGETALPALPQTWGRIKALYR